MNRIIIASVVAIVSILSIGMAYSQERVGDVILFPNTSDEMAAEGIGGYTDWMVCNVKSDLAVHQYPDSSTPAARRLKPMATVTIDTGVTDGEFVWVTTARRDYTEDGKRQKSKSLHVVGWAKMKNLCYYESAR